MRDVVNVKAIPGEECMSQHRLLVADFRWRDRGRQRMIKGQKKLRTWKLKDPVFRQAYDEEMDKVDIGAVENSWERLEQEMVRAPEKNGG